MGSSSSKVIRVDPAGDLVRLLEEAASKHAVLEGAGRRFRVVEELGEPFARYDPVRVHQALDRSFGSLRGLKVREFLDELREQRAQERFDLPEAK